MNHFRANRKRIKKKRKVTTLHGKTRYVIDIRNSKQPLNHGFIFKKVHKMIKFNQNAWQKRYINMNTKLRKKTSNNRTEKNLSSIRTKSSY